MFISVSHYMSIIWDIVPTCIILKFFVPYNFLINCKLKDLPIRARLSTDSGGVMLCYVKPRLV